MKKILTNPRFLLIISVIFIGAVMRLLPHWPNFTPITAMALFGGAYLSRKHLAYIIPLAAMVFSDLILGFHNLMIPVYLCFALIVFLSTFLKNRINPVTVIGASLVSSILFYLVTNFGVWAITPYYTKDISGIIQCYVAGLPFLRNGMLGDIFYNAVFFGGFYFVQSRFPAFSKVTG
ncbi:MAG: hypothetical protein K8R53_00255 [Bacteroidales bacterium]|nr:hypothetical protein [Bacteroidales bacterium]